MRRMFVGGPALVVVTFLAVVLVGCDGPGSTSPSGPGHGPQATDSATVENGGQDSDDGGGSGGRQGSDDNATGGTGTVHLSSPLVYDPTTTGIPTVDELMAAIQAELDTDCGSDQCQITVQTDARCADQHGDNCIVTTITPRLPARIPPGSTITVSGSDAPIGLGGKSTDQIPSRDDAVPSTTTSTGG